MNKVYLALSVVIVILVIVLGVVSSELQSETLPLLNATPTTTPTRTPSSTAIPTPSPSPTATPTQSPTAAPTIDDSVFVGNAEQASIANIAFIAPSTVQVLVQNSGSTTVNITQAYINGVAVTAMNPASPSVGKSASGTVTLTLPNSGTLSAGTSYSIKLITANGTQITNSAVFNP